MGILLGIMFLLVFADWYTNDGPGAGCLKFIVKVLVLSVCVWIVLRLFGQV